MEEISSGIFTRIVRGEIRPRNTCCLRFFRRHHASPKIAVAVRMDKLRAAGRPSSTIDSQLLHTATKMAQLNHPNVLKHYGVVTVGSPVLVLS